MQVYIDGLVYVDGLVCRDKQIHERKRPTARVELAAFRFKLVFTVKTLLTHTFRWTVQAMGFQRLWVGGGEKKISAQESCLKFRENPIFFVKIGLLDQKPNIQYHLGKSLLVDFSSIALAS